MIYLDYLLEATAGILRCRGTQTQFNAFSHDTRQLVPDELFVAIRGPYGDGHDYLLDAMHKGVAGLLVEAKSFNALPEKTLMTLTESATTIIVVSDTRLALRQYASFILDRWHPTVIAVTGSVGKTSTKEAIATVLSSNFATFRSWQNYNDLLGIPLSLGRLEPQHEYAVLELGADHPGEIADLCRMLHPTIGVLTNISPVQLQYFGSIECLALEMGTLLTGLPGGGHFFYDQEDITIRALITQYKHKHVFWSGPTTSPLYFNITPPTKNITFHPFASSLDASAPTEDTPDTDKSHTSVIRTNWDGIEATLPTISLASHLLGEHSFATMHAAYQVARSLGMSAEAIAHALTHMYPIVGRLYPLPGIENSRLLDDTHSSAPASLLAAMATLKQLTPTMGHRIAVLGDMTRLGEYEEVAHRTVGHQMADFIDYLVVCGEHAFLLADAAQEAGLAHSHIIVTSTHEDAAQAVRHILKHSSEHNGSEAPQGHDVILIKGSEETRMERVTEMLMAHPWEATEKLVRQTSGWKKTVFRQADRPTWVEIDLNAIGNNMQHIKALVGPQVQVLVSLKADAYGHGALKVARTALHNGATMLGVATISEAIPLRDGGISAPILVFGYVPRWQMREAVRLGVTVTLYSNEAAQELSQATVDLKSIVNVHAKVDTGMGRLGIRSEHTAAIVALLREIRSLPGLALEGLYTHFANADATDQAYTYLQLERFQQIVQMLEEQGLRPPIVHAANSAAILNLPEAHFDMVRSGIIVYGLAPSAEVHLPTGFRAALSFKTQVSQVKTIPAGEGISYGCTYITEHPTRIAVLPVGYADGFRRTPQNWGYVLIHGQEAPILGRVCMDQCMVDVTHIPQTRIGDEVVLIGRQGEAALTAETVAQRLGTINYEVVSEILARVPRVD